MPTLTCPSRDELLAYAVGRLPDETSECIAAHLESCADCQASLITLDDSNDTFLAQLRQPAATDPYLEESQCRLAVARARAAAETKEETPALLSGRSVRGRILGEYELIESLGRGGMGTVYKALHMKLDRVVALKVLTAGRTQDPRAITRFEREMKAIGKLDHHHIVRAYDAREIDGTPVLVMEYIAGLDLAEIVRRLGAVPVIDACAMARQAALGLQYAHEHGLVHRDIKPSNLMLTAPVSSARGAAGEGAEVKILDLGLARFHLDQSEAEETASTGRTVSGEITGTDQAMGTSDYMAPEQISDSRAADIRADIYSLGCTLYKLLTGRAPFDDAEHQGPAEKMAAHVGETVPPICQVNPCVPPELAAVLDRMLAKSPAARFASPADVAEVLERFTKGADLSALVARAASGEPLPAASPELAGRAWRPPVLRFMGAFAMIAGLGGGLLGMFLLSAQPPDIAGEWQGEDWGHVVMKKTSDTEYTGTYSDTVGERPGEIQLKWSRIERRFNGTWREGKDRFGELSVRLVDGEIRGALTTDAKSRINPATPRLADLKWTRLGLAQGHDTPSAEAAKRPERSHPNAIADAKTAKQRQEACGKHLGLPIQIINSLGMKLVLIPPGEFAMGSPRELIKEELKTPGIEDWYKDRLPGEGPQHLVRITRPFYFGMHLVTQAEYQRVVGVNPSEFAAAGNGKDKVAGQDTNRFPVENVTWDEAVEFCRKLSELPEEKAAGRTYQLPSEAQWEYACRAGNTGQFSFSPSGDAIPKESDSDRLCDYGWFDGNSGGKTHPVGEKKPNAWGLFDLHGNVWEWCQDWYGRDYYAKSPADDPTGSPAGTYRVCRGGGCRVPAWRCGSASRGNREPGLRYGGLGLRVMQVVNQLDCR
jgi:formylglycine-generating enzyme required for sulfatase activity/serine/threonine protein kinase